MLVVSIALDLSGIYFVWQIDFVKFLIGDG